MKTIKNTQLEELQKGDYRCYVTAEGFKAEATAKALNKKVSITHIQIGRGKLPADQSPASVINLVESYGEEGRFECSVTTDLENYGGFIVEIFIPTEHEINGKGYEINEAACLLDSGLVYAYRRVPTEFKLVTQGEAKSYIIRMRFKSDNAELISFTIDPSVVLATHENLSDSFKKHKSEEEPHLQYALLENVQKSGFHAINVASFSSPEIVDYILITSGDKFNSSVMHLIEITGRALFSSTYTETTKILIGSYFYNEQIYQPTALITTSHGNELSLPIFIVNNEGFRAYAIPGGYHSLLNVTLHCAGKSTPHSNQENWKTTEISLSRVSKMESVSIDSTRAYTSAYLPAAKNIMTETKGKKQSTIQDQLNILFKENEELRATIKSMTKKE